MINRYTCTCTCKVCGYSHVFYIGEPDPETIFKYHDEGTNDINCRYGMKYFDLVKDTITKEEFNKWFNKDK